MTSPRLTQHFRPAYCPLLDPISRIARSHKWRLQIFGNLSLALEHYPPGPGAGLRYPQLGGWGVGVLHFTLQREKSSYAHARAGARVCAFETEQREHPLPEPFSEVCVYGTGYALIITMFTLLALPQPGLQTPCSIGFLNSNAFFVLRIPSCVGSIWRSNVVRSPANIASADSMPASVAMSRSVRLT